MSASKHTLTVSAADDFAEISILDAHLNQVASGVNRLEQELSEGLYKVRVKVGPTTSERLVSLDRSKEEAFEYQQFPSPIPLSGTSRADSALAEAAHRASLQPRRLNGDGAQIFIFIRPASEKEQPGGANAAAGLLLLSESGVSLAPLESSALVDERTSSAGCCFDLTPGRYRLQLKRSDGKLTERTLVAVRDWQTQAFMLLREVRDDYRADLANSTVAMARRHPFQPDNDLTRLSELAQYALTQDRKVLSPQVREDLIEDKFENPMLGLFGAHLVLRDAPEDQVLFTEVMRNLTRLMGPDHPDIQALSLRLPSSSASVSISTPPMLRASWDLVVEASFQQPNVVAEGSLAERIGGRIVPSVPWLAWRADLLEGVEPGIRPAIKAAINDYIVAISAEATGQSLGSREPRGALARIVSSLTTVAVEAVSTIAPNWKLRREAAALAAALSGLDEEAKNEVARSFGVTRGQLEVFLGRIPDIHR
jgi:hypothetical protein